eukprot:501200-Prorocentrum_minimum.AAC.2
MGTVWGGAGTEGAGTEGAETSLASSLGVLGVMRSVSLLAPSDGRAMDGTTEARFRVGMRAR